MRETLIFNVEYLDWRIYGFTRFMVLREVYIKSADVGDVDVKETAGVSIHETFRRHAYRIFDTFSWVITSIRPAVFMGTSTGI